MIWAITFVIMLAIAPLYYVFGAILFTATTFAVVGVLHINPVRAKIAHIVQLVVMMLYALLPFVVGYWVHYFVSLAVNS